MSEGGTLASHSGSEASCKEGHQFNSIKSQLNLAKFSLIKLESRRIKIESR